MASRITTLSAGPVKRVYVSRTNAAKLAPPLVVECEGRIYEASHLKLRGFDTREFNWTRRNDVAPAIWYETTSEVEVYP